MENIDSSNQFIYDIASRIYKQLGCGHTEFIYHRAFEIELRSHNIQYESERRVLITFSDKNGNRYTLGEERVDILIKGRIIELKAIVNSPKESEIYQVHKYNRELKKEGIKSEYGIIINFPQAGNKNPKDDIDFVEIKFE